MSLELSVKLMTGEIKIPTTPSKQIVIQKKEAIIYKCYAHIMNNGMVGLTRKNKTKDSDKNLLLTFDGNTKQLLSAELIKQEEKEKIYDSSKFVIGL